MGDLFKTLKEVNNEERKKRLENRIYYALKVLEGYNHQKCSDNHYRIGNWSFWPKTDLFINNSTSERGRGINNFISKIQEYRR